jgi:hypothetical protein
MEEKELIKILKQNIERISKDNNDEFEDISENTLSKYDITKIINIVPDCFDISISKSDFTISLEFSERVKVSSRYSNTQYENRILYDISIYIYKDLDDYYYIIITTSDYTFEVCCDQMSSFLEKLSYFFKEILKDTDLPLCESKIIKSYSRFKLIR